MKRRSTSARKQPATGTQSVERALAVLEALGGGRSEMGLAELVAALRLRKPTVFRLLGALERRGFVTRDPARAVYRLGPALIQLGNQARRTLGLREAARPVLEALAEETGETATLEVLVGDDALILDEVQGRYMVGLVPEVGARWPAHATSTGKVLLAARGEDGVPRGRLARLAPNTIASRARLARELAEVRRRGWAVAVDEVEPGFAAVGAPVRDPDGRVVAAISVGGPTTRLDQARLAHLGTLTRRAADRISERLGAMPADTGADPPALGPPRRTSTRRR